MTHLPQNLPAVQNYYILLLMLCHTALFAQADTCAVVVSEHQMQVNALRANVWNDDNGSPTLAGIGALEYQGPDMDQPVPVAFQTGVWVGALGAGGTPLVGVTNFYPSFPEPFSITQVVPFTTCGLFEQPWVVSGAAITEHLTELAANGAPLEERPALYGYPGRDNPHFEGVNGFALPAATDLAPFFDADGNNVYDPDQGDYPLPRDVAAGAIPAELVWSIFSRQTLTNGTVNAQPPLLVRRTVFAYACADDPLLNATVFTQRTLSHFGTEALDSLYIAAFTDFELGCFSDDYSGSVPALHTVYNYNRDTVDADCGTAFQRPVPVVAATLLDRPATSIGIYSNSGVNVAPPATTDPLVPIEYYRYLTGSWRDGTPYTEGGNGYGGDTPTPFLYPDNPNGPGWSMLEEDRLPNDYRTLLSSYVGGLAPTETFTFDVAYSVHDVTGGNHLSHVNTMYAQLPLLQGHYDAGFANVDCPTLTAAPVRADRFDLRVSPNPAAGQFTVRTENYPIDELVAYDARGRELLRRQPRSATVEVRTAGLPTGLVLLHVRSGDRWTVRKVVVD